VQVERRVDREVARRQVLRVVALGELLADEVDEVGRVRAVGGGPLDEQRRLERLLGRRLSMKPESSIARSTSFLRSVARASWRNGL
jgi:hypothetical protein